MADTIEFGRFFVVAN